MLVFNFTELKLKKLLKDRAIVETQETTQFVGFVGSNENWADVKEKIDVLKTKLKYESGAMKKVGFILRRVRKYLSGILNSVR